MFAAAGTAMTAAEGAANPFAIPADEDLFKAQVWQPVVPVQT